MDKFLKLYKENAYSSNEALESAVRGICVMTDEEAGKALFTAMIDVTVWNGVSDEQKFIVAAFVEMLYALHDNTKA